LSANRYEIFEGMKFFTSNKPFDFDADPESKPKPKIFFNGMFTVGGGAVVRILCPTP